MANSYITPADLVLFYDSDRVLNLVSDAKAAAAAGDLSTPGSPAYQRAQIAVQSAAGDVDSHCQMGKRYTRENLEAMVAAFLADPNDHAKAKRARVLQQIVADLAFGILLGRRGYTGDQLRRQAPRYEEALKSLERLAAGVQVFDLDDNVNAGVPRRVTLGLRSYRPSLDNAMFGIWPEDDQGRINGPFNW